MFVVSIIVLLTGIVGPKLWDLRRDAMIDVTKVQMDSIESSLETFAFKVGRLPTSGEGLAALVRRPSSIDEQDWSKFMKKMPKDGWKEPFKYVYPSTHGLDFDLSSKGPDRTEGTEDDFHNWDGLDIEGLD